MPAKPGKLPAPQARARAEYSRIALKPRKEVDPTEYSLTPNSYGDILVTGGKLSGALQRDLIYWIQRYTWGYNASKIKGVVERPEWAKLSLSALAKFCQVFDNGRLRPVEKKSVAVALADLERRKIIESRDRAGCGKTVAKMYKLTPENWAKAKPYEPPTAKDLAAAEEVAGEDDDTIPDDAADPGTGPATVESGRVSRPQAVPVRMKTGPAVTVRLVYNPRGFNFPVTFTSRAGANGRVQITATPHQHSEAKANDYSCAQPTLKNQTIDSKRLLDFSLAINRITMQVWGKAADDTVIAEVMTAAGTAPVEYFEQIAQADKRLTPRNATKHSPRLLKFLAEEASRRSTAEQRLQAAQATRTEAAALDAQPTAEEAAWFARAEKDARDRYEEIRNRCEGCDGKGTRPSGITGVSKKCGLCHGSGRKANA